MSNHRNVRRRIPFAIIAATVIAMPVTAWSATVAKAAKPVENVTQPKSALSSQQLLLEKKEKLVKEAAEAVDQTRKALAALERKDTKLALADLEVVSGKLHEVLAKDPAMKEVPIDADLEVREFVGGLSDIEAATKQARDWLADQRVQEARQMLDQLSSEFRVTVVHVPLESYSAAIENAAALIVDGKTEEAKAMLEGVLHTLVTTTEIYPLPLLRAEETLSEAFRLEHTSDLKKEESRKKVEGLADETIKQLKMAEALGYGGKNDYQVLYDSIDALKQAVHTDRFQTAWDRLKSSLAGLRSKLSHATST